MSNCPYQWQLNSDISHWLSLNLALNTNFIKSWTLTQSTYLHPKPSAKTAPKGKISAWCPSFWKWFRRSQKVARSGHYCLSLSRIWYTCNIQNFRVKSLDKVGQLQEHDCFWTRSLAWFDLKTTNWRLLFYGRYSKFLDLQYLYLMAVYQLWRDYVDDPAQQDDDVDDQIWSLDQTGKLLEDFPLCSLPNASQGTLPPHRPLSIKLPPASTLGLEPSEGKN